MKDQDRSIARKVTSLACDLCFDQKEEELSYDRFVNRSMAKFHKLSSKPEIQAAILEDYRTEGMDYVVNKIETGEYLTNS